MALWQKVKQLESNDVTEILKVYSTNNIPIELRDLCAVWIEGSVNLSSAEKFCTGLRKQIHDKLASRDLSLPFYVTGKLVDFQSNLSTSNAAVLLNIFKRFQTCLDSERFFVNRSEGLTNPVTSLPSQYAPTSTTTSFTRPSSQGVQEVASFTPTIAPSLQVSSQPQIVLDEPIEIYDPDKFLDNPMRIVADEEMNSISEVVRNLEELSNNFSIKCHEVRRLQAIRDQQNPSLAGNDVNGLQLQALQSSPQFQELMSNISAIRSEIMLMAGQIHLKMVEMRNRSLAVMQSWSQLKTELGIDLSSWAIQQKLNANGKQMAINWRRLQNVSEYLMEVAWKLRGFLMAADKVRVAHLPLIQHAASRTAIPVSSPDIPEQIFTVTSLIKMLVQETFVVTHQPCQVLKTNTRFHILPGKNPMEICLFVGDKLGLRLSPPSVVVCIVDEATCKEIQVNGLQGESFKKVIKKGRLLPDTARLDFCEDRQCSTAVFRQISLRDFYRNVRTGVMGREQSALVTEEKFALLFRSEFSVGDIEFQVWRLSLPIVITTHVSQDSLAWAAVTWDNAFSNSNRIPFQLPDYVSWDGVSEMLNGRFTSMVGASLTQENIDYFAERLSSISSGYPEQLTWHEVCKNCLPGRKFTLWEWFFEGARLIEQYLKDAWKDGHVKGFIGKETSEGMLCSNGCLPGTFLLRFSESTLGGISVVWLHSDGSSYSLAPFKGKDLAAQPLVEKFNQETLHYVYPNMKKEVAFKKYYDEYEQATSGNSVGVGSDRYIKFKTQVVIDNSSIPKFQVTESNALDQRRGEGQVTLGEQGQSQTFGLSESEDESSDFDLDQLLNFMEDSSPVLGVNIEPDDHSPGSERNYETNANSNVQFYLDL